MLLIVFNPYNAVPYTPRVLALSYLSDRLPMEGRLHLVCNTLYPRLCGVLWRALALVAHTQMVAYVLTAVAYYLNQVLIPLALVALAYDVCTLIS